MFSFPFFFFLEMKRKPSTIIDFFGKASNKESSKLPRKSMGESKKDEKQQGGEQDINNNKRPEVFSSGK